MTAESKLSSAWTRLEGVVLSKRLCVSVLLFPRFFVSCEEHLRWCFGPGCLELPIFDCRLAGDEVATPLLQSTIGNQQWAMKTWSLVAAMPRCGQEFV
jgi:hypothetical protein